MTLWKKLVVSRIIRRGTTGTSATWREEKAPTRRLALLRSSHHKTAYTTAGRFRLGAVWSYIFQRFALGFFFTSKTPGLVNLVFTRICQADKTTATTTTEARPTEREQHTFLDLKIACLLLGQTCILLSRLLLPQRAIELLSKHGHGSTFQNGSSPTIQWSCQWCWIQVLSCLW
jgi:hypothetical protein